MENSIEIAGLTKRYGSQVAVDNLTLSVGKGEVYGLLGPNGAGKSTTILMLLGLTEVDSGSVKVCGIDVIRFPLEVKKKMGYLPENIGFYNDYSGLQNLIYTARLNNVPNDKAEENALRILADVGLLNEKDKKVSNYSRGMRQRLGLADVLIKNPNVIVLDEPTLGLDPDGVKKFLELIVRLSKEKGITVLFSSHHLHQIQQVCDRIGIFVQGRLLAQGEINSLAEQLFSKSTYTLKGELVPFTDDSEEIALPLKNLIKKIKKIKGVAKVVLKENVFQIESKFDVSAELSRLIVNMGFGLGHLSKKEYGLDDIYHQYFQGGKTI